MGMGKTLTFWLPLLFCATGIQIVVTPLNQLSQQNAVANLKYRAIIVSPEQLMKPGGEFDKLLTKPEFVSHIIGFVFDEAHCIISWGEFQPEYRELQWLRYIVPHRVPYLVTSATLTPESLSEVKRLLHLCSENLLAVHTLTNQPNLVLCVWKIKYTLSTYTDLGFLIPLGWQAGDPLPLKFLVFFDDIQDAINTTKFLRIKWFNSDMMMEFKEVEVATLAEGDTFGFLTTESFGMGMDISNICIVVQWKATCSLSTIWHCWGHAAQHCGLQGIVILFCKKGYFDDVHEEKHQHQEARK
ncbi:hypothetical protein SCLCIDRAFT_16348 [Scleroderma citrinum Foug A]|uniref:DNA 3'-5' helicase n=1 Tax=Scleroderma citrinum Foug A TaxID=1036808 RepID=A0A0C3DWY1_9AGAM|nr:hypothetical protein SCLCIDRAFT_16348 [Scleroderma citrinum Foug A]